MKQTMNSGHLTVNLHYKNQKQKHCQHDYEHTPVSFMRLAGRFVGKALYYKSTRDQDETSTFVFECITQKPSSLFVIKGYIFDIWHSILY